jgi:hypothetical protein
MTGNKRVVSRSVVLNKKTRVTIRPADSLGVGDDVGHDFSTTVRCDSGQHVIAERSTYCFRSGVEDGTNSMAAMTAANCWWIPEGTYRSNFTTYILLQNPDSRNSATCDLRFFTEGGRVVELTRVVEKSSRLTVSLAEFPELFNHDVATEVLSQGANVVAEQATYGVYHSASGESIKGAETSMGINGNATSKLPQHKLIGLGVMGNQYWSPGNYIQWDLSYCNDYPNTLVDVSQSPPTGDEGLDCKHAWFKNPQIYVPYDWFLEPYLANGILYYNKVFAQLESYHPDIICVTFCNRAYQPRSNWQGYQTQANGPNKSKLPLLSQSDKNAKFALGLDNELGLWRQAVANFVKHFGSRVTYYEIGNEPGFDCASGEAHDKNGDGSKVYRLWGDCRTDYPGIIKTAYEEITRDKSYKGQVIISGSLLSGNGVSAPRFTMSSTEGGIKDDYEYYKNSDVKNALKRYCGAIGIHLFQVPYDPSMNKTDQGLMRSDVNTWASGYNYLRTRVFGNDGYNDMPIFVTSCGWPWGVQSNVAGAKGYSPVEDSTNHITLGDAEKALSPAAQGFGLDGLLHNTTCPAAWYFDEVEVAFKDMHWTGGQYFGIAITYSDTYLNATRYDPRKSSFTDWIILNKQPLWDYYVMWIQNTDSMK